MILTRRGDARIWSTKNDGVTVILKGVYYLFCLKLGRFSIAWRANDLG